MQDDDDLKAWDRMTPVGREWGAPYAETLWALDVVAYRLKGTQLHLVELHGQWHLGWRGREVARWRVSETDWDALRAAVIFMNDPEAVTLWDGATSTAIQERQADHG